MKIDLSSENALIKSTFLNPGGSVTFFDYVTRNVSIDEFILCIGMLVNDCFIYKDMIFSRNGLEEYPNYAAEIIAPKSMTESIEYYCKNFEMEHKSLPDEERKRIEIYFNEFNVSGMMSCYENPEINIPEDDWRKRDLDLSEFFARLLEKFWSLIVKNLFPERNVEFHLSRDDSLDEDNVKLTFFTQSISHVAVKKQEELPFLKNRIKESVVELMYLAKGTRNFVRLVEMNVTCEKSISILGILDPRVEEVENCLILWDVFINTLKRKTDNYDYGDEKEQKKYLIENILQKNEHGERLVNTIRMCDLFNYEDKSYLNIKNLPELKRLVAIQLHSYWSYFIGNRFEDRDIIFEIYETNINNEVDYSLTMYQKIQ